MTTKHNQTNTDTRNGKEGVVSSNLTEGFTDNPHNQAENKKPYTLLIRAETPPTHQKLTTLLQRAIDSYALGNTKAGENYLAEAWPIAQNAIRPIITKRITEPDRQADAEQETFLKIWQAVRNWNPPTKRLKSGSALCRWFAHKASLNIVEKRDKHQTRETHSLNTELADLYEYNPNEKQTNTDTIALQNFAEYAATRAKTHRQATTWRNIINCIADGYYDRETIAHQLNTTSVRIRTEIHNMRKAIDLRALDQKETIVYNTLLTESSDSLFNLDYKEIG